MWQFAEGTTNSGMRRSILIYLGVMVGLATQLVRVKGVESVRSYAGYIAAFVMLSWLEYLMQSFT